MFKMPTAGPEFQLLTFIFYSKKTLDNHPLLWYTIHTSARVLFLCGKNAGLRGKLIPRIRQREADIKWRCRYESEDHFGLHGVQAAQL